LQEGRDEGDIALAVHLFEDIQELDRNGINGIWARIIKNAFAPLFQGRFDYVAGNPPWVNWGNLPKDYRQETAPLWAAHNLFLHKGFDAILGKANDDISVLMTYVAIDNYLVDKGRLGFLITQSVFKTPGGGQGFRRFKLGSGVPIGVLVVDDMSGLKPFKGASNRTAAVVLAKGRTTKFPVSYNYWFKPGGGSVIPEDMSLDEMTSERVATYRQFVAKPIDDKDATSAWITGRPIALGAVKKVLGESAYQARVGVSTWLNGVYWVDILEHRPDGLVVVGNLTEAGKRKVESIQTAMENDLLYPLLRGRDVTRWKAVPTARIIVTHESGAGLRAIPEPEMASRFPKTYAYLRRFEEVLLSRSGYRRYFSEDAPFYSIFDIGEYTFAPHKVVWREQAAGLTAAVVGSVGGSVIIPDHKLMMVAVKDEREAHYLCALLNSLPARFVVSSYGVMIQMDTHVLEHIAIPRHSRNDPIHRALSKLSRQAHVAATSDEVGDLQGIQTEIDRLAAQLWGLTPKELKDIRASLEEMA
jgi:hypothetical protein